jgi:sugar phosphate isomerase/epimerase
MQQRFSFQLYSARNHPPLKATLIMLAAAGYKEVEGYGGVYDGNGKLRRLLDRLELSMPSGHFPIEMLEDEKAKVLRIASALGMNKIVCPFLMPNDRPRTAKGWRDFGKRLNALAHAYRSEGYGFAWHNHDFEFMKLKGGGVPHELMFAEAPALDWEIDVAWVVRGGANPMKYIKKYAQAITLAHVKDIAGPGQNEHEDGWCDVGDGIVKWKDVFSALADTRCMHYVLEHDKPADAARFAKRSIAKLKSF